MKTRLMAVAIALLAVVQVAPASSSPLLGHHEPGAEVIDGRLLSPGTSDSITIEASLLGTFANEEASPSGVGPDLVFVSLPYGGPFMVVHFEHARLSDGWEIARVREGTNSVSLTRVTDDADLDVYSLTIDVDVTVPTASAGQDLPVNVQVSNDRGNTFTHVDERYNDALTIRVTE